MSISSSHLVVVGGGPAGLMAAECARAAGCEVDLYDRMGSVGRKFLIAGKGGLNLTHGEPFEAFVSRYRGRSREVADWLHDFGAEALREWARGLGVETFVGSSGRVFPGDLKAAPLLRGWVRRLRAQGVRFHTGHRLVGLARDPEHGLRLDFATSNGARTLRTRTVVLALGGGSWPELGSDGGWVGLLQDCGAGLSALGPANGGFELAWSEHLSTRFAGAPVKPVVLHWRSSDGHPRQQRGEFVLTAQGIEGGLVYAASADLRETLAQDGQAPVWLDLQPERERDALAAALSRPRGKRSLGEHLRRVAGLEGARAALLFECTTPQQRSDPARLAEAIKHLPMTLLRPRPLAEAISSAGGVRLESLDRGLMLQSLPGLFCAGEMLDWEAPTGGYLLTACFASGLRAGHAAARWHTRGGEAG